MDHATRNGSPVNLRFAQVPASDCHVLGWADGFGLVIVRGVLYAARVELCGAGRRVHLQPAGHYNDTASVIVVQAGGGRPQCSHPACRTHAGRRDSTGCRHCRAAALCISYSDGPEGGAA